MSTVCLSVSYKSPEYLSHLWSNSFGQRDQIVKSLRDCKRDPYGDSLNHTRDKEVIRLVSWLKDMSLKVMSTRFLE